MVVKTPPKSKKPSRHDSISEFRMTFDLNSMQVVFEAITSSFETIRWVVFIFHFWGAKIFQKYFKAMIWKMLIFEHLPLLSGWERPWRFCARRRFLNVQCSQHAVSNYIVIFEYIAMLFKAFKLVTKQRFWVKAI